MSIRNVSLIVLLIMSFFAPLQAQTYDKMWKELEVLERKDLPQSVVTQAMKIYDKAKAEQDVPQMMKAYLTAMQYRALLTPDSLKVDIEGLEQWASQTTRVEDKAVLYSILGEMTIPGQVKEGFDFLLLSLRDKDQLLQTSADKLKPMVEIGETSRKYFHDNLYDLLARRAIRIMQRYRWQAASTYNQTNSLPQGMNTIKQFVAYSVVPQSDCDLQAAVMQIYQSLLKAYDTPAYRSACLLTGIDALNYLYRYFSSEFSNEACSRQLRDWMTEYARVETVPQAYLALAQFLEYRNDQVKRLQVIREGIAKYPRYEGINQLRNIEKEILQPSLTIETAPGYPGAKQNLRVNYRNLTGITLQLYKVNLPVTSAVLENRTENFEAKYTRLQREEHYALKPTIDYLHTDTTLTIQAPQPGIYYLKAVPDGKQGESSGALLYVTALKCIYRPLPGKILELVIVDAMTGQPMPDAEVVTYTVKGGGYLPEHTFQADKEGTLRLDHPGNTDRIFYHACTVADNAMPVNNLWPDKYFYYDGDEEKESLQLFTDRSLYRPGQTVYVSGLAYTVRQDSTRVLADKKYTVALYDANGNEIGSTKVTTNGFGSFSGQFTLPSLCLPGNFRLKAGKADVSFKVEEYKRPTFEVTFEPVNTEYRVGDSIRLTGVAKTFAGAPVQNAKVIYNVVRSFSPFWRFAGSQTVRWSGEAVTDAEGKFSVPVHFEIDSDMQKAPVWYYTYKVTADVTDGAGETQQGSLSLPLGSASMVLSIDNLPNQLVKEKKTEIKFVATNLTGEPVDTSITYKVIEIENQPNAQPKEGKTVLTATAPSNKSFIPESIYALPSGNYRLTLSARDAQGRECTASRDFILFSLADKRPPIVTVDWFYQDGTEFDADSPATLYIGSSEKDVYLLYDVFAGNKRLESKRFHLSDSVLSFRFPYKKEYGEGILVSLAFVKDGKLYVHNEQIVKPQPEKKLTLKWTTFRDKLRPGQEEEWKLMVTYPDGRPAEAELLATMYDASLDGLYNKHSLPFSLYFYRPVPITYWNTSSIRNFYVYVNFPWKRLKSPALAYSELLIPQSGKMEAVVMGYGASARAMNTGAIRMRGSKLMAADVMMKQADTADKLVLEEEVVKEVPQLAEEEKSEELVDIGNVQVRQNFAETAFFYPQLRTNEKGEISFSFVLPESLTQWRFLGLAHTQNVDYGHIEATATASKEFMLQPNMPRFVRVGDRADIAASLINLSDKSVKGMVRMELFNPETEKVFYSQKQKFDVKAGETTSINFSFAVTDKYRVLACRMVADGDTFSDGEQRYIPVLTDKQWVTETVPLDVEGEGKYTFSLEDLFNKHSKSASEPRMTVEFTSNPAWYVVQALPVVANPLNDDALSWSTAYYANSLAAYIVKANPRIKKVFDSWKAQGGTKETLLSNLEKNEELKNILLAETPWVAEARNETEQKQRIATLFDLNTMNSKLAVSIEKLKALQQADGAWSWYSGMYGSPYVTTQVMEMLARLHSLTGMAMDSQVQGMYQKGMGYLSAQAEKEYEAMKEAEKKGATALRPSEEVLRYLYICALDKNAAVNKKVNQYFIDKLASKGVELTIYGKAMGAIILQQNNKTVQAKEFIQSLMEYSVMTKEMGRYFDTPKAHYTWLSYKIPTEVAAIEAIQRVTQDIKVVDEMKRWLLMQKQTQTWDTPIATADAIYALIMTGSSDLLTDTGRVKITLGKETIQTSAEDAIGYIKKTVTGDVMDIRKVTVDKEGTGMGWGAVYAQYLENMDKIDSQGNTLSISRQLYRGKEALDASTPLAVGDRVTVRLTVNADRDMDFVQIKDERPACMEPVESLSGYRWKNNLGYYQATKDASTQFFIDQMRKGTYVIEYQVYVNRIGEYQAGIATIQSAYAPEFGGHTGGYRVVVK